MTSTEWLAWNATELTTDSTLVPPDGLVATAGHAYIVDFRRGDAPRAAILIRIFAATDTATPDRHLLRIDFYRVSGTDPRDPIGSETWSHTGGFEPDLSLASPGDADATAHHIATLLDEDALDEIDAIDPAPIQQMLDWDGEPYELKAATPA